MKVLPLESTTNRKVLVIIEYQYNGSHWQRIQLRIYRDMCLAEWQFGHPGPIPCVNIDNDQIVLQGDGIMSKSNVLVVGG